MALKPETKPIVETDPPKTDARVVSIISAIMGVAK